MKKVIVMAIAILLMGSVAFCADRLKSVFDSDYNSHSNDHVFQGIRDQQQDEYRKENEAFRINMENSQNEERRQRELERLERESLRHEQQENLNSIQNNLKRKW